MKKEAPSAGAKNEVSPALCECVLRACSTATLKRVGEIHADVINDYGTVSERQVYRALKKLMGRKVKRVHEDDYDSFTWGYLRI